MNDLKARQLALPLPLRGREFTAPAHALLAGRHVRYIIKRSARRRSISLRIDEDGLRVGAPASATQRAIDNVLREHAQWIARKLGEWEERRTPAPRWTDGDVLMLHGEPLTLRLVTTTRAPELAGGSLVAPDQVPAPTVIAWLRDRALSYFSDRTAHFCSQLALDMPHVRLSNARTRWGSCHIEGRIHLNWRLIQMPLRLVDYVVAHEVAHLKEMNHSARFWRIVGMLVPDFAARRKEIRCEGHRYLVL
jgi:predicted metal-dependent hydrolase